MRNGIHKSFGQSLEADFPGSSVEVIDEVLKAVHKYRSECLDKYN